MKGKGDGKWFEHRHFHRPFDDQYFHGWDGKLALAQDKAPSRGEPGEPRRFYTDQRTPSPKLGGAGNKLYANMIHQEKNLKEV